MLSSWLHLRLVFISGLSNSQRGLHSCRSNQILAVRWRVGFRDRRPYFVGVRLGTEAIRQSHQTHYLYTHHTEHGHALDLADALEICGCIVPVRLFSGDRRGHEKVPHGLQGVHTRITVTENRKMWGGNTIERWGHLEGGRGHTSHLEVGGARGEPLLFRFTIAMRFLESDGVTRKVEDLTTDHTDCSTAHTPTRRGKTLLRDASNPRVMWGVLW